MVSPHLRMLANLLKVVLVILALRFIYMQVFSPDTRAVLDAHYGRFLKQDSPPPPGQFSDDEMRIANRFLIDTLPGLMHKGLIKKYERNEYGTIIFVSGRVWKARSPFFIQSFMKELLLYNKVCGYLPRAQVVDSVSGNLYAEISPEAKVQFYD